MIKKSFVLSGGGCRGYAHLGVVKALDENGIRPAQISGTSTGALVGAFLANGFTPDQINEVCADKLKSHLFAWNGFKMGIVSMKNLREFLLKNLRYTTFETLQIPLYVSATNFQNGRQQLFSQGDIIEALLASCAIPVLFPPVSIGQIPYVDGGLSANLPVEPFIANPNEIINAHVNPLKPFTSTETLGEILDRAIHLTFREKVELCAKKNFLFIEPTALSTFGLFDINRLSEIFGVGYSYTKQLMDRL